MSYTSHNEHSTNAAGCCEYLENISFRPYQVMHSNAMVSYLAKTVVQSMHLYIRNLLHNFSLSTAPEKRGRIQKSDLSGFISRTCRPFGVLLALLERDLLKGIIGAYRKLR